MRKFSLAAICAAGVVAAAGASQATVATITFNGTVAGGIDQLGLFGTAGTDLAGDSFSAFFQYTAPSDSPGKLFAQGGSGLFIPVPDPTLAATITVNGSTFALPAEALVDSYQAQYIARGPGQVGGLASAFEIGSNGRVSFSLQSVNVSLAGSTLTIDGTPGLGVNNPGGNLQLTGMTQAINFGITSATISPVTSPVPIPEPETWALMISGFGAAGAMLRRRRGLVA